jgi:site-specific DNA-cytosine methylase
MTFVSSVTAKWAKQSGGPAGDEAQNLVVAAPLEASDGHHGYSSTRGDGADNLVAYPIASNSGECVPGVAEPYASFAAVTPSAAKEPRKHPVRTPGMAIGDDGDQPDCLGHGAENVPFGSRSVPRSRSPQPHPVPSRSTPTGASVRRLTPTECERLQAFPDGWTQLGGTPDSRRYAALGDAVTVNVAEWIGRRLRACGWECG